MKPHVLLSVAVLLSSFGCAAPAERDEVAVEHDDVASDTEAFNFNPDFAVGIVAVKYFGSNPTISPQQWTSPLSQNPGSSPSGATTMQGGFTDMTGPRIGPKFNGAGTLTTIDTDFRVSITAWYNGATGFTCPCTTSTTPWASDGGGGNFPINWPASNPPGIQFADRYEVSVDVRPWPSGNSKSLVDFRLGVLQCMTQGNARGCSQGVLTSFASELATNGKASFSNTADWADGPLQPATYVPVPYLDPVFQ